MGNALPNFRELAQLEEREPKVVEMLERFEATQSDLIRNSIQSSLQFMKLVGDIAYLYFPALMDTAVFALDSNTSNNKSAFGQLKEKTEPDSGATNWDFRTPDLGDSQNDYPGLPGEDGPSLI